MYLVELLLENYLKVLGLLVNIGGFLAANFCLNHLSDSI